MAKALAAPNLRIPDSDTTVSVRIIDTTSHLSNISVSRFISPPITGFDNLDCPAYSFLIEHPSSRKLLFDLGVRKDHENLPPTIVSALRTLDAVVTVDKGVRELLEENGVPGKDIEAVIWSHHHWDHTGDPSTFDSHTALIVGPGFKGAFTPGYPANPDGQIRESDYAGRELREIAFTQGLRIGRFNAFDYFGDGSFYLLDSPGHTIGHLCALARVTTSPNSYIFMGGDACHHGGEFRPSPYLPLPSEISPNPLDRRSVNPCPGAVFSSLLRNGDTIKPFYSVTRPEEGESSAYDPDVAEVTIGKVQEADARNDVLVIMAHDDTLLEVVDFFPKYANDFKEKGWVQKGRWLFLKDFAEAVKK